MRSTARRCWSWLSLFFVVTVVGLVMLPSSATASDTLISLFTVSATSDQESEPAVSGDWVVWTKSVTTPTADHEVWARNLVTDETFMVAAGQASQADISGDTIVFDKTSTGDHDVYGYNLSTRTQFPIAVLYRSQQGEPRIDGDTVVWADNRSDVGNSGYGWQIYRYSLASQKEAHVCDTATEPLSLDVSGSTVVWVDGGEEDYTHSRRCRGFNFNANPPYGTGFQVETELGVECGTVDIEGNRVVYSRSVYPDNSQSDIYLYNINDGTTIPVCAADGAQRDPSLCGNLAVWSDHRNYPFGIIDGWDVYAKDLSSESEFLVFSSGSGNEQLAASVPYVVWTATSPAEHTDILGASVVSWENSLVINGGSPWTNSPNVDVAVSASSSAGVVDALRLSNDGSAWRDWFPFTLPASYVLPVGDGAKTVYVQCRDERGFIAPTMSDSITLDTVAPTTTCHAPPGWVNHAVDVTLSSVDTTSGVNLTRYSVDGHSPQTGSVVAFVAPPDHTGDGIHALDYWSTDNAGNVETAKACAVRIDTTPPVTQTDDAGWFSSDKLVQFSVADPLSGVASTFFTVDSGPTQTGLSTTIPAPPDHSNDGIRDVQCWSVDNVGNAETPHGYSVGIDTVPPVSSASNATSGWHDAGFVLNIQATDGGSGVAGIQYSVDGGAPQFGSSVAFTTDGTHEVAYWATDTAGNIEGANTCEVSSDVTPPSTVDDAPSSWVRTAVSIHLTASDATTGVARTEYRLDAETWTNGSAVRVNGDGDHILNYYSVDGVGNTEDVRTAHVRIDTVAPLTSARGYRGWHNTPVYVSLDGSDATSGVARTHYRIDDHAWQSGQVLTVSAPSSHANDGIHSIHFYSVDIAGNRETTKSCTVRIDTKGPATLVLAGCDNRNYPYANIKYRVNDALSRTARVTVKIWNSHGDLTKIFGLGSRYTNRRLSVRFSCGLAPGNYHVQVFAKDLAGNPASSVRSGTLHVYVWWRDAATYRGKVRTVLGPVKSTTYASSTNGSPTFLNVGNRYPIRPRFAVVIWGENRGHFSFAPESYYAGHLITVTGKIVMYRNSPQIAAAYPSQIRILR